MRCFLVSKLRSWATSSALRSLFSSKGTELYSLDGRVEAHLKLKLFNKAEDMVMISTMISVMRVENLMEMEREGENQGSSSKREKVDKIRK